MKKLMIVTMMLAAVALTAGCSESDSIVSPSPEAARADLTLERQSPASATSIVDVALAVNADTGEFSTLIAALVAADLVDALDGRGQFTVFAPTDAAFAAIGYDDSNIGDLPVEALKNILLYHVAQGRRYAEDVLSSDKYRMLNGDFAMIEFDGVDAFIDGAPIVQTDVEADNGVIHIIGGVMLPPEGDDGRTTIVDVALAVNADTGEFSTLIAALGAADLVGVLDGKRQFTVFAPTDAAFAAIGYDATNIGDLPVDDLANILLYHVAPGRRYAEDVLASDQYRMFNGDFAMIEFDGVDAFIDGAPIVQTDVMADNGVIHIIGGVMLP